MDACRFKWWFGVVCSLIDNNIHYHKGQNVVDLRGEVLDSWFLLPVDLISCFASSQITDFNFANYRFPFCKLHMASSLRKIKIFISFRFAKWQQALAYEYQQEKMIKWWYSIRQLRSGEKRTNKSSEMLEKFCCENFSEFYTCAVLVFLRTAGPRKKGIMRQWMKTHIFVVYLLVKSSGTLKLQEGNVITHSFWLVVRLVRNNLGHRELLFTLRCGRFVDSIKCTHPINIRKNIKSKKDLNPIWSL